MEILHKDFYQLKEPDDIILTGDSYIRPSTIYRYIIVNYGVDSICEVSIYDIAKTFISKGIDYGYAGDLLLILMMFKSINRDSTTSIDDNNFLDMGEYSSYNESIDNIFKTIQETESVIASYKTYDRITIGDVIRFVYGDDYNREKYPHYLNALADENTYRFGYSKLYYDIYLCEKELRIEEGSYIRPVTKSVLAEDEALIDKVGIMPYKSLPIISNNYLVIYNEPTFHTTAILLAQQYNCPYIRSNDLDRFKNFNVIIADNV